MRHPEIAAEELLAPAEARVLATIGASPHGATAAQIADETGLLRRNVDNILDRLSRHDLVVSGWHGSHVGGRPSRHWRLSSEGAATVAGG